VTPGACPVTTRSSAAQEKMTWRKMLTPALFRRAQHRREVGVTSPKKPTQLSTSLWNLDALPRFPCGLRCACPGAWQGERVRFAPRRLLGSGKDRCRFCESFQRQGKVSLRHGWSLFRHRPGLKPGAARWRDERCREGRRECSRRLGACAPARQVSSSSYGPSCQQHSARGIGDGAEDEREGGFCERGEGGGRGSKRAPV